MSKTKWYTVSQTAKAVGVSRARTYQRIHCDPRVKRGAGRFLPHRVVERGIVVGRAKQGTAHYLVSEESVSEWRQERILKGLRVGCLRGPNE